MKKIYLYVIILSLLSAGVANATMYYESYEGAQNVSASRWGPSYYFLFDIDQTHNGRTNSNLAFTNDATGFEYWNNEQLGAVSLSVDVYSTDRQREAFDLEVNIYWSNQDFTERVVFNAEGSDSSYNYVYDFTQAQIDGWEAGGWGSVTIDPYYFPGNDFRLDRVAMNASTAPVPEPATMLLFGTGMAGLAALRRKKR